MSWRVRGWVLEHVCSACETCHEVTSCLKPEPFSKVCRVSPARQAVFQRQMMPQVQLECRSSLASEPEAPCPAPKHLTWETPGEKHGPKVGAGLQSVAFSEAFEVTLQALDGRPEARVFIGSAHAGTLDLGGRLGVTSDATPATPTCTA